MADNNAPAAPVVDQAALSALDARQRVVHLHQEVTNLLHFQSHVRLQGLVAPSPPGTGPLNDETREKLAAAIRKCYDKHALRADAPIPRMFFLFSCTMTLLYLCSTDTDTIILLRLHLLYHPLFDPGYCYTIPCSLVPDTSHLYSLIWYALCPTMYINPCT